MRTTVVKAFAFAFLVSTSQTDAQNLPAPSRTVYKCTVGGKTVYTDEPCLGAQTVDVEPTRGINKSTGKERVGSDVSLEKNREAFAEAIRPITGMDSKQLDVQSRRVKLSPEVRAECAKLDGGIRESESQERTAAPQAKPAVAQTLMQQRQRHKKLGC